MIPTRRFGRTELSMPVLTCGGMRFQHRWDEEPPKPIPAENQANLSATIHRAVELGIVHLETARGYGTSEAQLAPVVKTLPREQIILQTKVSPQADPNEFERVFRTSLSRLDQPFVDLFSLHGINQREILEWSLRPGGCLERARQFQKQGLCRWVGFSTHGSPELVEEAVSSGKFDYVNLHWYYIFQEHTPSLAAAKKNDMGVFIISPNDKGGMLYQPPAKLTQATSPLTPMEFNALFCLRDPRSILFPSVPPGRQTSMNTSARLPGWTRPQPCYLQSKKGSPLFGPKRTRLNGGPTGIEVFPTGRSARRRPTFVRYYVCTIWPAPTTWSTTPECATTCSVKAVTGFRGDQ